MVVGIVGAVSVGGSVLLGGWVGRRIVRCLGLAFTRNWGAAREAEGG